MQTETLEIKKSWKTRRKEQLRDDMISAARELFEEKGIDATSVDEIVAKTGIAKGTFYLYFKTKADIAQTIIEEAISELQSCVAEAIENAHGDASSELKAVIHAQLSYFVAHKSMIPILLGNGLMSSLHMPPQLRCDLHERFAHSFSNTFERIIRKGMLQGLYREIDAPVAAMMLKGMISGALQDLEISCEDITDLCNTSLDFFEKGIGRGK